MTSIQPVDSPCSDLSTNNHVLYMQALLELYFISVKGLRALRGYCGPHEAKNKTNFSLISSFQFIRTKAQL